MFVTHCCYFSCFAPYCILKLFYSAIRLSSRKCVNKLSVQELLCTRSLIMRQMQYHRLSQTQLVFLLNFWTEQALVKETMIRPIFWVDLVTDPGIFHFVYYGEFKRNRAATACVHSNFYSASAQLAMLSAVLAIVNPSVCPSVRPSVNRWHCVKTTPFHDHAVFTGGQLHDSSFLMVNFAAKFQREPRERGRRMREGQENRQFQPICHRISETVQDRTKVTINH